MPDNRSSSKYDRQERLSLWNQDIISKSTILIAGIGGTGCEVAKNLSLLGIGHLILVDGDTIEFSNLNRQLLFGEQDVGLNKAIVAQKRIQTEYNPDIRVDVFTDLLQNVPERTFEDVDIIAGCVDNFLARQYLNSLAVEFNLPFIDSATDGYFGQVQYVKPGITACLACDNPLPPDETRVLSEPCTLVGIPRTKEHCAWKALYEFNKIHQREPIESSKEDIQNLLYLANKYASEYKFGHFEKIELLQLILYHIPSLITVNAVISGIQSQEIIKALFLTKKNLMKAKEQKSFNILLENHRFRIPSYSIYSSLTGTVNSFELAKDRMCLVCGDIEKKRNSLIVLKVNQNSYFKSVLDSFKSQRNKKFIGFRGTTLLPPEKKIKNILNDGDRITLSSVEDEDELRVKLQFSS